ncbi:hypothetical protein A2617_02545 [Candidatus Daviesbacteria bacterium RIFOXYD1_FULL_41_10]|uniref:Uncharacterized protein n=3 Tax=Patescibacteria group TaxID=1783273 RepID=A0A1F5N066_9BACT|nr:MAG: hypothetical protein UU67_C0013G0008 [Candidatus Daviesbacteria bacterium GW2011_GWB1_41_5]KKT81098.1 MAG: hypothetical protein UW78_C0017G0004 [Candidatus Azambacteria bacterium GW2011_GWA1_44_9]OGE71036.1 MAG: hypothetical protein A2617_02545 [Candidatus Daviesbacteria bacterium RIFOXYD1_FULL_41_10]
MLDIKKSGKIIVRNNDLSTEAGRWYESGTDVIDLLKVSPVEEEFLRECEDRDQAPSKEFTDFRERVTREDYSSSTPKPRIVIK